MVCLATVYLQVEGQKEEVMRDVAWVRPESSGLRLVGLMGESRFLQAKITSIDLLHNSIILQKTADELLQRASAD